MAAGGDHALRSGLAPAEHSLQHRPEGGDGAHLIEACRVEALAVDHSIEAGADRPADHLTAPVEQRSAAVAREHESVGAQPRPAGRVQHVARKDPSGGGGCGRAAAASLAVAEKHDRVADGERRLVAQGQRDHRLGQRLAARRRGRSGGVGRCGWGRR